ncbi:MAG: class I SAM-dependent methyltransferase [bacterium]
MNVFNAYANYYDLLYQDKNYAQEADYVHNLIKTHAPQAKTILDLGCGTGTHTRLFAEKNYTIHGIDQSPTMIEQAHILHAQKQERAHNLSFSVGDLRTLNLDKKYDVIMALFHVMSYQTQNQDLHNAFTAIHKHLNPGGLFIFDFWYGPAVLAQKPEPRIKKIENNTTKIVRFAQPEHDINKNKVNVNYTIYVHDKKTTHIHELAETHRMRYFFKPEVATLFNEHNFDLLVFEEWLTRKQPTENSWGVCTVGKKQTLNL